MNVHVAMYASAFTCVFGMQKIDFVFSVLLWNYVPNK